MIPPLQHHPREVDVLPVPLLCSRSAQDEDTGSQLSTFSATPTSTWYAQDRASGAGRRHPASGLTRASPASDRSGRGLPGGGRSGRSGRSLGEGGHR
jgi:hypothetical protein